MVTQNKTWRFSKRINNDNYNVWRKSTSEHFDLGAVISSLLKTPPLPGEVHINSSKLREEHIGIWKNGGVFL